ncbi:ATP-dependent protease LonB [Thermanaeromonas sp.]|uniref:ATP-dependent protease LonB n=1 Tax=Thermanaeromonas sp. TaxID=2003697 RepID=UPI0026330A43|nr:ATP-dependent protease LonB [Thermanaeromonas sp.]
MAESSISLGGAITFLQVFLAVVAALYLVNLFKSQPGNRTAIERESRKELEKLKQLRQIALSEPLAEKTRPTTFEEIIGQEEGLKALRAALCGPNPQHVIIYGPPGVGKTAAARLVLEEAKKNPLSPFREDAQFVEIDGATSRFDERGIADPLIGSVHDPIYQGAGPLGLAGIPQPKPGAVTKAHGGILFIDEIGELHPIQINKLLKVLEDRKVLLESAYYSSEDTNIPPHIHDIFKNGLPADFRLVGATTRLPQEIPAAIRSRCVEIYFRPLLPEEIGVIVKNAVRKINLSIENKAVEIIKRYATNGREAVNMVQLAAGLALTEGRQEILRQDVEWVVSCGQYSPRPQSRIPSEPQVGVVNGLAVYGPNMGVVVELEASAHFVGGRRGRVVVTGVVDEEEMGGLEGRRLKKKSMARNAVDNVLTALRGLLNLDPLDYDLHLNFVGAVPVDGPSAGLAMVVALYSAFTGTPVDNKVAMTGEISLRGFVRPVGGIMPKVEAARLSGVKKVLIPAENWQENFRHLRDIEVIPIRRIEEALEHGLYREKRPGNRETLASPPQVLSASPLAYH